VGTLCDKIYNRIPMGLYKDAKVIKSSTYCNCFLPFSEVVIKMEAMWFG
jgi:hypothetical protein